MEPLSGRYQHKIKTAREVARLVGERPRQRKVIMCHGVFDVVHPGHLRHLLYAKTKADVLVASLTATSTSPKANIGRMFPRTFAQSTWRPLRSSTMSSSTRNRHH